MQKERKKLLAETYYFHTLSKKDNLDLEYSLFVKHKNHISDLNLKSNSVSLQPKLDS